MAVVPKPNLVFWGGWEGGRVRGRIKERGVVEGEGGRGRREVGEGERKGDRNSEIQLFSQCMVSSFIVWT